MWWIIPEKWFTKFTDHSQVCHVTPSLQKALPEQIFISFSGASHGSLMCNGVTWCSSIHIHKFQPVHTQTQVWVRTQTQIQIQIQNLIQIQIQIQDLIQVLIQHHQL